MQQEFKPFDRVLVRAYCTDPWRVGFFSHYNDHPLWKYCTISNHYQYCIPYDGNEALEGTVGCDVRKVRYEFGDRVYNVNDSGPFECLVIREDSDVVEVVTFDLRTLKWNKSDVRMRSAK